MCLPGLSLWSVDPGKDMMFQICCRLADLIELPSGIDDLALLLASPSPIWVPWLSLVSRPWILGMELAGKTATG